jgi:predicted Holliday junction resolvase-like endonuclease
MSERFGLVFLILFVLAAAACIYLSITMSRRVQRGINRWRDEEMQSLETQLRDLANADARIQIERWKQQHEQEIRLDTIQRSSAVTRGKVTEHIVPYLPGFDLDPKDIRFLALPLT